MEQYGMKIRCTAFKKNIEFLWGINYNGDIGSEGSRLWQKLEDHR
jgi:hypothetical protein